MRERHLMGIMLKAMIVLMWACAPSIAQEPVKIGFMYVFSGRVAHYGHGARQGAEIALEEINAKGGILGRQIAAVYEDTELKPEVGVKAAKKLVDQKVDVVMGIVSSGVAQAVAPVMNELRVPLIVTLAMTPDITGSMCNPYTFRVSLNGPQNLKGASILAAELNRRKWTTLAPDYVFGYQCWEYFQKYLKEKQPGAIFAGNAETVYAPMTEPDLRPYIRKTMESHADGILVSLYGGNLIDFIRQGNEMRIFDGRVKFLLNLAYSADVMYGLGLDIPKGLWLSGLYWFQANDSPENQRFVETYKHRYKVFPDYNAHGAYAGVKVYAAAVEKAGSTNKEKVVKALEGLTVKVPAGSITIRAEDHQAIVDGVWGLTSEYDPKLRTRTLDPMKTFPG
ncbi:MAG: ABC transporter substrate-binding protein, partial [Pseudomonadota bacterium]